MKNLKTTNVSFIAAPHAHAKQALFSVNSGVDAKSALHVASDLIHSVMDVLAEAAVGEVPLQGNSAFMVSHALSSAGAALDAVLGQLEKTNDFNPGE